MKFDDNSIKSFRCPRWEQLPTLPLYMDQVILVLQDAVEPFFDEKERVLTASMVNNYVKQGLIPSPEKKRYTNDHVARLIMVGVLKRVLTMSEIAQAIQILTETYGIEDGFNRFGLRLEEMLAEAFGDDRQVIGPVEMQGEALDVLNAAFASLMGRLLVQSCLHTLCPPAAGAPTGKEKKEHKN